MTTTTDQHGADDALHAAENDGYHKGLKTRQVQMIAIGGAIGTGLFMGAGGRLAQAGPALVIAYAVCGFFAFLILRALGELVLHRPTSGSFVSYAREFFGEKAAFVSGWLYWLNWSMTAVVDVTAVALYMNFFGRYWDPIASVPQWVFALAALLLVLSLNLVSVKVFGELEFWFALIKVLALVAFLCIGLYLLVRGTPNQEQGLSMIADNGGLIPNGLLPAVVIIQGVVFAYASIELVGTAAGETPNPEKVIPKAINTVIIRIAVFYVGSVLLLSLLLPYSAYRAGESPFVTFFGSIGVEGADTAMNLIVLTAALSSLNAGLYSTGRILRSMAAAGSAPRFAMKMSKAGVPYGGILLTAAVTLLGVVLNAVVPEQAFEIVLNLAALGIVSAWAMIVLCQLKLWHLSKEGVVTRPSFRLFGAPYTGIATLVFLVVVLVLMGFDYPIGTWTLASLLVIVPALVIGWRAARPGIERLARERARAGGGTVAR
ncbi:amino acid permease [Rhodococcus sp. BP-149]|uniref:amino acid permease n=1 Tax=unclassified Rhodococcus (in: high G+C Gram-positive bacteria) TaxID=192944 RepID=UPI001C9A750F|nr:MULTISPECIES: amino acid permease [unclassified Rhodococcus (in: high G+C Gram-positive bacteria)]MBY6679414.1 amino acid permease [Rhodococcus sp. BP-332]MBY6687341.1 amino acid permease [Rhodococcus sp. BP-288]MBY6694236.1 amino acid permease [Rhodococcus sp. BP-188]MBY6697945.1 amino acid permease [Rhodococcus sp. BP-285]MBY6704165.1 amino acid permease [Rhodococcus sp. BP-283]